MTREQIYEIWKPSDSPWSPWVKPVLFSYMHELETTEATISPEHIDFRPTSGTAIIVNLPGAEGVRAGIFLCKTQGFRPIPIYNACPNTIGIPLTIALALVNVAQIVSALAGETDALASSQLPSMAAPAFLIDQSRQGRTRNMDRSSGWFDNRSFITPFDFPSAAFLKQHGVTSVLLVQRDKVLNG